MNTNTYEKKVTACSMYVEVVIFCKGKVRAERDFWLYRNSASSAGRAFKKAHKWADDFISVLQAQETSEI